MISLEEDDPDKAIENFRDCLKRINSIENYSFIIVGLMFY